MESKTLTQRWFGTRLAGRIEPGSPVWFFRRDRIGMACLIFIILVTLIAIFAPVLTPYAAEGRGEPNIGNKFLAPSYEHPFGAWNNQHHTANQSGCGNYKNRYTLDVGYFGDTFTAYDTSGPFTNYKMGRDPYDCDLSIVYLPDTVGEV